MSTAHEPIAKAPAHVYAPPVVVEVKVTVKALAFREADGGYSIVVPELPGCVSEGDTIEEAQANIVEAAEGWLAAGHDENRERAIRITTEPFPSEREESE
jgi:predicted RNase H-like HicB family nuclease